MSTVFLYGDVNENFAMLSKPFVNACGGKRSRIALLMLPRSQHHETRYREAWLEAGAGEITAICPPMSMNLRSEQLSTLRQSTGIFMAGGETKLYQRIYGTNSVSRLIGELHAAGIPYGGVSAGAMMACDNCMVSGSIVRTKTNEFLLASKNYDESCRGQHRGGRVGLIMRKGLGLVKDCIVLPHFTEWGFFPGLVEAMELTESHIGVGMDEGICLELREGKKATVRGRGRLYFFHRDMEGSVSPSFKVELYEPGACFDLPSH